MTFTQINTISSYSFTESSIAIEDYIQTAKRLGYDALGLVDVNSMTGAFRFYQLCLASKIKPILGLNWHRSSLVGEAQTDKLLLLAKNFQGYQALLQIASLLAENSQQQTIENIIEANKQSLYIILDGNHNDAILFWRRGDFNRSLELVNQLEKLVAPKHLILGIPLIQNDAYLGEELIAFSKKAKIPAIALPEIRYLEMQDAKLNVIIQTIRNNTTLNYQDLPKQGPDYLRSPSDYQEHYLSNFGVELAVALDGLVQSINIEIPTEHVSLPHVQLPEGLSSSQYLERLCKKGERGALLKQAEYRERFEYELSVIIEKEFSDYFLIVQDFVQYAKSQNILMSPGRGSAAGSLVSYLLGITQVDPLKYDLLFERFLNPGRNNMPDIDLDFADDKRHLLFQYAKDGYGQDRVGHIGTFNTWGVKSVLKAVTQALGISNQLAQELSNLIPSDMSKNIASRSQDLKVQVLISKDKAIGIALEVADRLVGLPQNVSIHAAGLLLSSQPLVNYTPTRLGSDGLLVSQYPMNDVESLGLLKIDLLGIRTLSQVSATLKEINRTTKQDILIESFPLDDENVYNMLANGQTYGVFQFDTESFRASLKQVRPRTFEQLTAVNALNRPGPSQYIPSYARRIQDREQVTYLHADLENLLSQTEGIMIYQEQIMQIANQIAGFTLSEADDLRKGIAKKQEAIVNKLRTKFVMGCVKNGYSDTLGQKLYADIERFGQYGFNKSHAVAYTMLAYQMAYLKYYYPSQFYSAGINSLARTNKAKELLAEARVRNIPILKPDVNKSGLHMTSENGAIRFGFTSINRVGLRLAEAILYQRQKGGPYLSFEDFFERLQNKELNKDALISLIQAGAFDNLDTNRKTLIEEYVPKYNKKISVISGLQQDLFQLRVKEHTEYSDKELAEQELAQLDYAFSYQPFAKFHSLYEDNRALPIAAISAQGNVTILGEVEELRIQNDRNGRTMAFGTIRDDSAMISFVCFADQFEQLGYLLRIGEFAVIIGNISINNNGSWQIQVNQAYPLNEAIFDRLAPKQFSERILKLILSKELLDIKLPQKQLLKILQNNHGTIPVVLLNERNNQEVRLDNKWFFNGNMKAILQIEYILGKENVKF